MHACVLVRVSARGRSACEGTTAEMPRIHAPFTASCSGVRLPRGFLRHPLTGCVPSLPSHSTYTPPQPPHHHLQPPHPTTTLLGPQAWGRRRWRLASRGRAGRKCRCWCGELCPGHSDCRNRRHGSHLPERCCRPQRDSEGEGGRRLNGSVGGGASERVSERIRRAFLLPAPCRSLSFPLRSDSLSDPE